mgnify:FL=1
MGDLAKRQGWEQYIGGRKPGGSLILCMFFRVREAVFAYHVLGRTVVN